MLWYSSSGVGSLEYILGIHHNFLVISQVEITLLIYCTINQGNILVAVIALPIHYELFPLLKQNNLVEWLRVKLYKHITVYNLLSRDTHTS